MEEKKFAIFDMDGTLVDSMGYWRGLSVEFLGRVGITEVSQELLETVKPMILIESAGYFVEHLGLDSTPEAAAAEMVSLMREHYARDIQLKTGVKEYLETLSQRGVRMCVASATPIHLVDLCLSRLGIRKYFDFLISCESVGTGKQHPNVYLAAMHKLDPRLRPGDVAVYEDAIVAIRTAKQAGFYTIGIYDDAARTEWEHIQGIADVSMRDYSVV